MQRSLLVLMIVAATSGCTALQNHSGTAAGTVGGFLIASELEYLEPQYLAGALVAYAIYDPFAPTWRISVTQLDEQHMRIDLRMKGLVTGGEGEARQIFMRNARQLSAEGGFAGFEVVRYEEGIDSTRPFARRFASGELRVSRSQTWPAL